MDMNTKRREGDDDNDDDVGGGRRRSMKSRRMYDSDTIYCEYTESQEKRYP